jgi:serine/threonine-protein kinase
MLVAQIVYEPLATPSVRGVSLGTSFDEWFAKCCARDPAARFNSAGVAIEALEKALGLGARQSQPHFGVTAMAQTSPAMAATSPLAASLQGASVSHAAMTPPPKRSSRVWMLIGGVAIVALGAVGGGVVSHSRSAAGVTTSAATSNAGAITTITATAEATALVATITADPQTVTTGTVRLPTVQPRVAGSGRRETSSAVATVSSPLPPPSASATVKKPTDNELLNSQH